MEAIRMADDGKDRGEEMDAAAYAPAARVQDRCLDVLPDDEDRAGQEVSEEAWLHSSVHRGPGGER